MRTSVIIPSFESAASLPRVLDALAPQVEDRTDREVLVIDSSGCEAAAAIQRRWPWVRVIGFDQRVLPGRARNIGTSLARGELLAFLDADAVPACGWLDELEGGLDDGIEMVAGAILNGTPEARWGTAAYLLEFLEWSPHRLAPLGHAASCNLLIRRAALERVGGFPEDMWPGEDTVLSAAFATGGQLAFVPAALVLHLNRVALRTVLAHQRLLGSCWVEVCRRVALPGSWMARPALAPLAVLGRAYALLWQLREARIAIGGIARHAPQLAVSLCAWGLGVAHPVRSSAG